MKINKKGQYILNVGSGVPTNVLEVAQEIISYLNSDSVIKISGAFREGDIRHNFADLKLIKDSKNWTEASRSKDNIKKKFSTTSEYLIFFFSILALIIFYIIFNN